MKVAIVQAAMPTSNTTLNFTDSSVTSDWKGAIFWGGSPTANASSTAGMEIFIGATDGTRNVGHGQNVLDNTATATANAKSIVSNANCITRPVANQYLAAYNATLSNGVQLSFSAHDSAHLVNCLLFAGTDIEFAVSSASYLSTDTTKTITHNLTGTPDCVMVIADANGSALDVAGQIAQSIGFYDGTNSVGSGFAQKNDAAGATVVGARTVSGDMGHWVSTTPADFTSWTIGTVGASTFAVTRGSAGGTSASVICISWRHLSSTAAASAFIGTTATGTGNNVVNTGMAVAPQLWLNVSTRLASTAFASDDTSGSWGFSAAVNNLVNGIQQMSAAGSTTQGVATSVAKTQTFNNQASATLQTSGAMQFESTVSSWNAGGVTENVGTAPATAFERINLMYGIVPAAVVAQAPITPRLIYVMP